MDNNNGKKSTQTTRTRNNNNGESVDLANYFMTTNFVPGNLKVKK
jgi:hypothetical protein